jgi:hypothetical protein
VRIGGGLNWLRIVSSGECWFQRCCTFGFCEVDAARAKQSYHTQAVDS